MGWFWGSTNSGKSPPSSEDPFRDLDPGLREFLSKESPVKYSSSNPPSTAVAEEPPQNTTKEPIDSTESDESKVPAASLFKDGRYAHLWSTYQPQAAVESAIKSDQEKIDDVLQGYKARQAEIGRAALENCALEQWDVNECFRGGGLHSRLTMCRAENRKFERCYQMQAKFLKALGYLSTYDRPPEVDEQIQMHADTLYHRMIDQEAAIEAAKAEGKPIPIFSPLVSKSPQPTKPAALEESVAAPPTTEKDYSKLPVTVQQELKKRLEGKTGEDRDIEEKAIMAEMQTGVELSKQLNKVYKKQEEEKKRRREQGRETIGDRVSSALGLGPR